MINAPVERCFDLSRSIDLHVISTQKSREQAIAGRTTGLIALNESVTWRARHFYLWQKLTSKITAMDAPKYFVDEMVSGAFRSFRHEHHFSPSNNGTLMTDKFYFTSPLGWLGSLADNLFLKEYMTNLLIERNKVIKATAESDDWKRLLG
jgi:ligand-binding SRPBCC domain-containing protein